MKPNLIQTLLNGRRKREVDLYADNQKALLEELGKKEHFGNFGLVLYFLSNLFTNPAAHDRSLSTSVT